MADAKRIAKNTMYMYLRMILVMGISLYTSRAILDKLGVDDYGLYCAVGSVVAVMSFLNATLNTSTSRFLTFALGRNDLDNQKSTFSTAFYCHLTLAGLIILVMETGGLWYLLHKFVIPEGREEATYIVYQFSIFATAITVCRVPLTGAITAHEDFNIFAFISILKAVVQLLIVYLLSISPIDKLVFYAFLIMVWDMCMAIIWWMICKHKYPEVQLSTKFDKKTFWGMMEFTGWTTVANLSNAFITQGSVILLNLFFAPAIIAAKAVANQVTGYIMVFVNNFRVALNPQIIKSYAAGNFEESKKLTLTSATISFDLMLSLGLPFVFIMDSVLNLWLVEVPPQAVLFTQIAVISSIFNSIATSTYTPFIASGKQKLNGLWGLVTGGAYFVGLYIIYKCGGEAVWVQYLFFLYVLNEVIVLRPYLLTKELGYDLKSISTCYWECTKVFIPSFLLSTAVYSFTGGSLWQKIILFVLVFIICLICSFAFMNKAMRNYIIMLVKKKFKRN